MNIIEMFFWFISTYWFTIPIAAVVIFLLALETLRTINNVVLYIRASEYGGGTMEFLRCRQQGTNLEYMPQKGDKQVSHIASDPYIWVKGMTAYRVYIVVQGSGKTSGFPYSKEFEEMGSQAIEKVMESIDSNKQLTGQEKAVAKKVLTTVSLGQSGIDVKTKAAAASISFFERFAAFIGQNLPKSKTDYMTMLMYILVGFAVGFAWGMIVVMKGIW